MAVTCDHAPEHAVSAGRERGQSHLDEPVVGRAQTAVTRANPTLVRILDADIDGNRLDGAIEPDADLRRRLAQRGARPRFGTTDEGMRPPSPDPGALQNFLERVFSDPQLRQKVEEMRPNIRQSLERAGQDRQALPDAPAQTLKPPGGTSP